MLEWISVYWFSRAGPAASIRIYYEVTNTPSPARWSPVPCGLSFFPQELDPPPRTYVLSPPPPPKLKALTSAAPRLQVGAHSRKRRVRGGARRGRALRRV